MIERGTVEKKLELAGIPVACTIHKIGEKMILDPTLKEEEAVDGRLTVTTINGMLCAMQKGGTCGFTPEEVFKAIDISLKKGEEIRKKHFVV